MLPPPEWSRRWQEEAAAHALRATIGSLRAGHTDWQRHLHEVAGVLDVPGRRDLRGVPLQDENLRHADLRNTDLRNADLRGADLREASLDGADLRGCALQGAIVTIEQLSVSLHPQLRVRLAAEILTADEAQALVLWRSRRRMLRVSSVLLVFCALCSLLGVSGRYLYHGIRRGALVTVKTPRGTFRVQRHEVARWQLSPTDFDGRCQLPSASGGRSAQRSLPASCVDLAHAEIHCRQLGMHLPRDEEWQDIAQSAVANRQATDRSANVLSAGLRGPLPVDELPSQDQPLPELRHLFGNIGEWTSDNVQLAGFYIVRGGSYLQPHHMASHTVMDIRKADRGYPDVGFRCIAEEEK